MVKTVDYQWWRVLQVEYSVLVVSLILIISLFPSSLAKKCRFLILSLVSVVTYSEALFGIKALNSLYYTWRFPFDNPKDACNAVLSGRFKTIFTKSSSVKSIIYQTIEQTLGNVTSQLVSIDNLSSTEVANDILEHPYHYYVGKVQYMRLIAHEDSKNLVPYDRRLPLGMWYTTSMLRYNSTLKRPVTNAYYAIMENGIDQYWHEQYYIRFRHLDVKTFKKLKSNAIGFKQLEMLFLTIISMQLTIMYSVIIDYLCLSEIN